MAAFTNGDGVWANALVLHGGGMELEQTLFCGQSFSWEKTGEGVFAGVAGNRAALARQQGGHLVLAQGDGRAFAGEEREFWENYFALDMDYALLQAALCRDETLARCVAAGRGIRVLRQPFFDTLISFIISQNNHIPRIMGIVARLRQEFGQVLPGGQKGFPAAADLAGRTVEELAPLRAGFRAKYILDAAQKVAAGEVCEEDLRAAPQEEARRMLCTIKGVGPKVADCVLLYALGHTGVVPMDVWMKRAMETYFPNGMPTCAQGFEGVAQQYVFCCMRAGGAGK